jgi:hypothetical protein
MFRVEVCASQKNQSEIKHGNVIVKMMPTLKLAIDKLGSGSYNVQEKEMDIFQKVFPEMRKILKSVDEDKNIFPKAFAVDRVKDVLVLEDLAEEKFVMADRKIGLSLDQLKISLEKLAKFHAASMVLMENQPGIFDAYDVGMFSRKTSAFHTFFSTNLEALIDEVSSWNGYEKYATKLENLKMNLYENSFKVSDNDEGDLKVLTHGDLWLNNFMFSYDKNGELKDAIMVELSFYFAIKNHVKN